MSSDVITNEQKRGGTFREKFVELHGEFNELMKSGAATPALFESSMVQLLKSFENVRLQSESTIRKLEREIAFNEATLMACNKFSNLVVSVVAAHRRENCRQADEPRVSPEDVGVGKDASISDVEMLKTICLCGCQDEIDAADCKCECHTKGWCDREDCVVCRKAEAEAKKSEKSPKKKTKKETKKTAKKKATKKRK